MPARAKYRRSATEHRLHLLSQVRLLLLSAVLKREENEDTGSFILLPEKDAGMFQHAICICLMRLYFRVFGGAIGVGWSFNDACSC